MQVIQIDPRHVVSVWPKVESLIGKALLRSKGEYSLDQLKVFLTLGHQALLVAIDDDGNVHGAATVSTESYPNATVAFVTSISGRLISTPELFDQFKAWCVSHGYTSVRGCVEESLARLWRRKFKAEEIYRIVEVSL